MILFLRAGMFVLVADLHKHAGQPPACFCAGGCPGGNATSSFRLRLFLCFCREPLLNTQRQRERYNEDAKKTEYINQLFNQLSSINPTSFTHYIYNPFLKDIRVFLWSYHLTRRWCARSA
eukprot:GHVS01021905.1.p1 GENE.GHVS01021905.1~~GHVS01021905.1.p1  ORF type:complete len:120 (-),score=8.11 GHVS01021905.1:75-434(-)